MDVGSTPTRATEKETKRDRGNGDVDQLGPVVVENFNPYGLGIRSIHGDVDQPGRSRHAQNVDSVGSNPTVTTGPGIADGPTLPGFRGSAAGSDSTSRLFDRVGQSAEPTG